MLGFQFPSFLSFWPSVVVAAVVAVVAVAVVAVVAVVVAVVCCFVPVLQISFLSLLYWASKSFISLC